MYGVAHICVFRGKRCPPVKRKRSEPRVLCSICDRKATGYAMFPWGASPLCTQHIKEECGP
jgi:hypothetical protein